MPFHTLLKIKVPEKALQSNAIEKLWLLWFRFQYLKLCYSLTIFLE